MNNIHTDYLYYANGKFGISEKLFANMKYASKHMNFKELKDFKAYKNHSRSYSIPMLDKVNLLYTLVKLSDDVNILNKTSIKSLASHEILSFGYNMLKKLLYFLDYFNLNYSIQSKFGLNYNISEFIYDNEDENILFTTLTTDTTINIKKSLIKINGLLNYEIVNYVYNESNFSYRNIALYLFSLITIIDALIDIDRIIDNRFSTYPPEQLEWFMEI